MFNNMKQGGSNPKQTVTEFSKTLDGIRSLGAYPLIKLPPCGINNAMAPLMLGTLTGKRKSLRQLAAVSNDMNLPMNPSITVNGAVKPIPIIGKARCQQ